MHDALAWVELGHWLADGTGASNNLREFASKDEVFAHCLAHVHGSRTQYLEFGVYEGNSLRWWAGHLTDPSARFVGFDSFEGLPEDWRHDIRQGEFRTAGPPLIDDPRVSFVVGWFDETLPKYELPACDQLIVNIDSDLYSSAMTVLKWLEPHLRPGTLVYFDELVDCHHELRAFIESLAKSGRRVTPLGFHRWHWLFRYE
ncbi:MAG: class I SAM-dependent methyltransferase [Streptosporangiaceae bacterium]